MPRDDSRQRPRSASRAYENASKGSYRSGTAQHGDSQALRRLRPDEGAVELRRRRPRSERAQADPNKNEGFSMLRLTFLGIAGVAGFCAAFGKLIDYTIVNRDTYLARANARRLTSVKLPAKRGTIYDRNGNVLTKSIDCKDIAVQPKNIKEAEKAVRVLARELGLKRKDVRKKVTMDADWVYIQRQVDTDVAERIQAKSIAGIVVDDAVRRSYPYGNLASQVLGVVNVDGQGLTGIEKRYDKALSGTAGSLYREHGRDGDWIAGAEYQRVDAQDGHDIVLTIDATIQRTAEDAIAEAVEQYGAKTGSVVVTDPTTGEILAACSYPTYDPTDLAHTSSSDMNLRFVTDSYEPGSVFKTLVVAAGIDADVIDEDTTFEVPAKVKVGDDMVGDSDGRSYTMNMTVREIIRRSSNTGMALVGEKMGAKLFAEGVIENFGIGTKTGIDFPGEGTGIVKKRSEYDGASVGSMSFGQSLSMPPVETLRAVSSIANGGIALTPHFLKSKKGKEKDWASTEKRVMSEEAAQKLTSMMEDVVSSGTGEGAGITGYTVAGKTGTAERASEDGGYQSGRFMASFFGFAPAASPHALVYVMLDDVPHLSSAALPAFKTVMTRTLDVLGIEPSS